MSARSVGWLSLTVNNYHPAPKPNKPKRGRPKLYETKARLQDICKRAHDVSTAPSPVDAETNDQIRYRSVSTSL